MPAARSHLTGIGRALTALGGYWVDEQRQDEYEERLRREEERRREEALRGWELDLIESGGGLGSVPAAPRVTDRAGLGIAPPAAERRPTPFGEWGTTEMIPPPDETPVTSHLAATGGRVYRPIGSGEFRGYIEDPASRASRNALAESAAEAEELGALRSAAVGVGWAPDEAEAIVRDVPLPEEDTGPSPVNWTLRQNANGEWVQINPRTGEVRRTGVMGPDSDEGDTPTYRNRPTVGQALDVMKQWELENGERLGAEKRLEFAIELSNGARPDSVFTKARRSLGAGADGNGDGGEGRRGWFGFGRGEEEAGASRGGTRSGRPQVPPPDSGPPPALSRPWEPGPMDVPSPRATPRGAVPPPDEGEGSASDTGPSMASDDVLQEGANLYRMIPGGTDAKTAAMRADGWSAPEIERMLEIIGG